MTVSTQVKQTFAGLKSAQASFETFAMQTQNQQAKQLYTDAAQQLQNIVNTIAPRISRTRTTGTSIQRFLTRRTP